MKKFLYKGKVWNLAGYHVRGWHTLIWREDFNGHSGHQGALEHKLDPNAAGHCWWVLNDQIKPYIEMEENE